MAPSGAEGAVSASHTRVGPGAHLDDLEAWLVAGVDLLALGNLRGDALANGLGHGVAVELLGDHGGAGGREVAAGSYG
jgi:hypothetical protein